MNTTGAIRSQYHAALDMLEQAIVKCPDALWDDRRYQNIFWQIAYHVLFFTHLYLQPTGKDFALWAKGRQGYHEMGKDKALEPYCREDILEYLAFCRQQVEEKVPLLDLDGPSGFSWLPFNKLELQFYNIRHLQHHTGELSERLGATGDVEVGWVSTRPEPPSIP
jgi:hypothetical protein